MTHPDSNLEAPLLRNVTQSFQKGEKFNWVKDFTSLVSLLFQRLDVSYSTVLLLR